MAKRRTSDSWYCAKSATLERLRMTFGWAWLSTVEMCVTERRGAMLDINQMLVFEKVGKTTLRVIAATDKDAKRS